MSVVPMKFVTLAAPVEQFDFVVRTCVLNRQFQPEFVQQVMRENKGLVPFDLSNPFGPLYKQGEALAKHMGFENLRYAAFEPYGFTEESVAAYFETLEKTMDEMEGERGRLHREAEEDREILQQLESLAGIDADLSKLFHLEFLRLRIGHMPRETYDAFKEKMDNRTDMFFFPTRMDNDLVYGCYFATRLSREAVDTFMTSLHFVRTIVDSRAESGTVEEAKANLSRQAQEDDQKTEAIDARLKAFAAREEEKLMGACTFLRNQNETFDLRRYAARTKDTFYLMGWVPVPDLPEFEKTCRHCRDLSFVAEDAEDIDYVTPPTKLKSGPLSRVFQPFLRMYGLPSYHELDPSFFMAITYCLFAGIMFGDVGHGFVLLVGGWALWQFKKIPLGRIIACCGVSSMIFGCIFGSVFGYEELIHGFKVLEGNNVVYLLLASIGLGVVMIFIVMVFNICNGFHQKNYEKALFGANGIAGMVFYFGFLAAAVVTLLTPVNLFTPAYLVPVVVLPLVLIMLKEPLGKLCARRPDWKPESIGNLLVSGFFELFETALSFVTNTLSFLRVGAYAISHTSLMLVVWAMAGDNHNPVVLVLCNLFVIGFEGMLVGIQVLRLEFYELFGRFYDDGGREFTPKVIQYTKD